jgi:hypothetical protein
MLSSLWILTNEAVLKNLTYCAFRLVLPTSSETFGCEADKLSAEETLPEYALGFAAR